MKLGKMKLDKRRLPSLQRLHGLRERRARSAWREQQATLTDARQEHLDNQQQLGKVEQEACELESAMTSPILTSQATARRDIGIRQHWIRYDRQKAQYFLQEAEQKLSLATADNRELMRSWQERRQRLEQCDEWCRKARLDGIVREETRRQQETDETRSSNPSGETP